MTYLDYATPIRAAGASQRSDGSWILPNRSVCYDAAHAARVLRAEPLPLSPPRTRTMSAIRRESMTRARGSITGPGMAVRAVQYAEWLNGNDRTPHSSLIRNADKRVTFDRDAEGNKRARKVDDFEIPHWDWIPTVEELPGLFE